MYMQKYLGFVHFIFMSENYFNHFKNSKACTFIDYEE